MFLDHTHIPVASVPPLEQNILQRGDRSTLLQGGDHAAITVPLPEPCSATTPPPSQDLMPSHSGPAFVYFYKCIWAALLWN